MTEVKTELGPCTYGDSSKNSSSEDVVIDILLLILLVSITTYFLKMSIFISLDCPFLK